MEADLLHCGGAVAAGPEIDPSSLGCTNSWRAEIPGVFLDSCPPRALLFPNSAGFARGYLSGMARGMAACDTFSDLIFSISTSLVCKLRGATARRCLPGLV